jgi:hypothetical protein
MYEELQIFMSEVLSEVSARLNRQLSEVLSKVKKSEEHLKNFFLSRKMSEENFRQKASRTRLFKYCGKVGVPAYSCTLPALWSGGHWQATGVHMNLHGNSSAIFSVESSHATPNPI